MSTEELLRQLVLYHNDPTLVAALHDKARQGEVDAQYALGLVYAEGRGVEPDPVRAYMWLSLAVEQGDEDAKTLRFIVAETMSATQLAAAEQQTAEYQRSGSADMLH